MECLVVILIAVNLFLAVYTWQGRRKLTERIVNLEKDVLQLRLGTAILPVETPPIPTLRPVAETALPVETATVSAEVDAAPAVAPAPVMASTAPVSVPPVEMSPTPPPPLERPRTTPTLAARPTQDTLMTRLLGWFQRTSLLVQVGVVVLFFGIAFLLRYAAEQGWLSIELRLAGATLLGIGLIGVGWRLRIRRRAYALALQGGGIGVLYLTAFAAHRLYSMLPASLAFAVFVGLGVVCVLLALFNDAAVLAFLAVVGAFSAPILAATEGGDHVGLFGYYALINLGIFAIAWFKAWRNLNWVGFFFTLGVGAVWGATSYEPQNFATVEPFLIFFFVLYTLISLLFSFRQRSQIQGYVDAALVFGLPLAFFSLQTPLVIDIERGLAWSALGTGLWYLLLTAILYWRARTAQRLLLESFAFLAVAFLTTSVPFFFDAQTTAFLWAVEGAGLVWVGTRQSRLWSRLVGTLILLGASASTITYYGLNWQDLDDGVFILNSLAAGTTILSLSFFVAAYALHRYEDRRYKTEVLLLAGLLLGGFFWWYIGGLLQIGIHADPDYFIGGVIAFLALSAALMDGVRPRLDWRVLGWPVQWLTATLLPLLLWLFFEGSYPTAGGGWYAWPLALAVHFWALRRHKSEVWRLWGHLSGFWLILILLTDEVTLRVADSALGEGWIWATLLGLPALILWGIWHFAHRLPWPFGPNALFYRTTGIAPVGVVLLALGLMANLSTAADSTPLPYLPLLNPFDLVQAFFLIACLAWIRRELAHLGGNELYQIVNWLVGICAFVTVNAALARAVHHLDGVPFVWSRLFDSALLQTLFAVVWGISALIMMFLANRRRNRPLWFGGAALLALTVLKLFLVDLSSAETLGRIVSFLAVGLLILLIGYIAPMPPSLERAEPSAPADDAELKVDQQGARR